MPVLHKHPGRNEYYVVTSNNGTVATFKLTGKGMKRLRSVGLADGENFDTSILLDLYRSGDAFTHGKVTADAKGKSRQMKFDFLNETQPKRVFPCCSACGLVEDLHLVEVKAPTPTLTLLCRRCRRKKMGFIDTSIPLPLVSRGILKRLLTMKKIGKRDSSVTDYQKVLEAKFSKKWEEVAMKKKKSKSPRQADLFQKEQEGLLFFVGGRQSWGQA
jgi:hypothetical protein